jgi:hypothetical protein
MSSPSSTLQPTTASLGTNSNSTLTAGTIQAFGNFTDIGVASGGTLNANSVIFGNEIFGGSEVSLNINGTANIGLVSLGPLPGPTSIFTVGSGGVANVGDIGGGLVSIGGTLNFAMV